MYFLGLDIGSSSVKASLIDGETGNPVAAVFSPEKEMAITALHTGWAEQNPETWWLNVKLAVSKILSRYKVKSENIKAIGIAYQMHGLVMVDKNLKPLYPSIIWCDSRAATIGEKAFNAIGKKKCLNHFLNSPGNFTASKLKWIKDNKPAVYNKIYKFMLPGDYIAMKMSGTPQTTTGGLSEAILWDYKENAIADMLLNHYGISKNLIPEIVPTFDIQAQLTASAAKELGLKAGTKITYRSGDQPNNAFSLNVLNPGELATTAGTSGVIYGVTDQKKNDTKSRVNTFIHVNHATKNPRYGVLMCVNGTGILNSWLRKLLNSNPKNELPYEKLNQLAAQAPIGSQGLKFYPFGNGAERLLQNKDIGAAVNGLEFNTHTTSHVLRSAQEGIAFALNYGLEIMSAMMPKAKVIRAGESNMFLSKVFRQTFASVTGTTIELYKTDGAQGAARGAAVGYGYYSNFKEAFQTLKKAGVTEPDKSSINKYHDAYNNWLQGINKILK